MKVSKSRIRQLISESINSVIKEESKSKEGVICDGGNGLEMCAGKIKKHVLSKEPGKKTVSLKELNEMFDFYLLDRTSLIRVMEKGIDSGLKNATKFELSEKEYHHQQLNYNPFGMTVPPKVVK